jgi:hypothetical protein
VGVGVHDAAHELREGAPGVAIIVGEGVLDGGDVLLQAFGGEPLKKLLLGGVATVEGADAYASAFGYSGDRSARISYEHFSCGIEDSPVVASRFCPPTTQRRRGRLQLIHEISIPHLERSNPFCYTRRTEYFVPQLGGTIRRGAPHD